MTDVAPTIDHAVRIEYDPLGAVAVPADRLYGPQTERARLNFPLSGTPIGEMPALLVSLAEVKKAAALTSRQIGDLPADIAGPIDAACDEIIAGQWSAEFPIDVLQGGAGTSTNMNMNEVIANRALQLIGAAPGAYDRISPNDHVNRAQSTNDVYATAVRLAVHKLNIRLEAALERLAAAFAGKAIELGPIAKLGRTQLQDAVPITLEQEFTAYAVAIAEDASRARDLGPFFLEVNLGGTAIGTGIGASRDYAEAIVANLRIVTGLPVTRAHNLVEATWDMGAFVLYSGFLKRVASKLSKIANDLRLLSSGPRGGIGEIRLPQRQPGSSLMPGKVNPVIPEAVNQVAFRIFGLDTAITFAAEAGQLQLNAFEPLIIASIHEAVTLIVAAIDMMIERCVAGIEADPAACEQHLVASTALATALVPLIGYGQAAAIARHALTEGVDLRAAVAALSPLTLDAFDALSAPADGDLIACQ